MQEVAVKQVFRDLVPDISVSGFFDGQPGEGFRVGASRGGHRGDDGVNLLLRKAAEGLEGRVGRLDLRANLLDGSQIPIFEHRGALLRVALGQDGFGAPVGGGNDVDANQLAEATGSRRSSVGGRFDRPDVPTARDGHVSGTDLSPAFKGDAGGLDHRVRGFDRGDQAEGLDHSQRLHSEVARVRARKSTVSHGCCSIQCAGCVDCHLA